jgi:hypothetical protein
VKAVEGYLACKWGLQSQLPATHPYAKTCPASGGQVSSNFFYDVHNSLRNFAGDAAGNALGGKIGGIFKGGNGTTLF